VERLATHTRRSSSRKDSEAIRIEGKWGTLGVWRDLSAVQDDSCDWDCDRSRDCAQRGAVH
jgi:hypothetical protein